MVRRAKSYLELNSKFLEDAVQASEKLWGAAAEIVKMVAAKRGKQLRTHSQLWSYVERLNRDHPDLELITGFHVANSLHQNFYEGSLGIDSVEVGA